MEKKNQPKNGINTKAPLNRPDALVFPTQGQVGIGNPDIALPPYNPPVPNRAWTAMRMGKDIDELSREDIEEMRFD